MTSQGRKAFHWLILIVKVFGKFLVVISISLRISLEFRQCMRYMRNSKGNEKEGEKKKTNEEKEYVEISDL